MKSLRSLTRTASALALLAGTLIALSPAPATAAAPEVRGYVDGHSHLFSYEAFGGALMCGKPFDPGGIARALRDCPDHLPNGELAWFENFTRTGSPTGRHDPVGWPTFRDWPAHDSFTHQQAYYTWVERAWRGGLRVLVNHLVANRQLCAIYPLRRHGCDEMDSIRLQAQRARELQDHIDAEHGGPGQGWFRIVTGPAQARQVAASGKLAVILGVETSEPFGCRQILGLARCTRAQIDRGLDEMYELGVRSMFVCHKYDNALCGVRFDSGTQGAIVNIGNLLGTGRFWQARTCATAEHDNTIEPAGVLPGQIARLLPPGISLPAYPAPPHCNTRGLTSLGEHMVQGVMRRGMLIEIDHMSVKAAGRALDLLEAAAYPGVVSSHSWTDQRYLDRIWALGGMVTQYGHDAGEFVAEWRRSAPIRQAHQVAGYGYGLDANGMGRLPGPRSGSTVTYPFTTFEGVTLDRQRTGDRVWDVNADGVANYGLVPDWIEDMRTIAGPDIVQDLASGAESYLRTWESAAQHATAR